MAWEPVRKSPEPSWPGIGWAPFMTQSGHPKSASRDTRRGVFGSLSRALRRVTAHIRPRNLTCLHHVEPMADLSMTKTGMKRGCDEKRLASDQVDDRELVSA